MKLNNKGGATTAIIIILTILLVASLGYIGYDKFIAKDEPKDNQTTPTEVTKENKVSVVDAVDCVDEYWQGKAVKIVLPKIVNGGTNAEELNKTILSDTLSKAYRNLVRNINDEANSQTLNTSYSYIEKDGVIMISILVHFNPWPASGSGHFYYYYFYDTKADKILDVIEGLNAFGYSNDDLLKIANEKGRCYFDEGETYTIETLKKDFDFSTGTSYIDIDENKNISLHISSLCI